METLRQVITLGLVGMVLFSGYGLLFPQAPRCSLPGAVGCPGGLLGGPTLPAAGGAQWFDVTLWDYGFWIVDTVTGQNDSSTWNIYEGYTIHINTTSLPPDPSVGGTNVHGLGIDISGQGTIFSQPGPVGSWTSGSFTAPTAASSGDTIYCTIYCGPGHSSQYESILNVVAAPNLPVASASASPQSGSAPLAVSFTGGATGGTPPYTYSWNFGDGSAASTAMSPSHTYNSSGSYSAKLTVTDSAALVGTASATVKVAAPAGLTANATASPYSGYVPLSVSFTGTGSGGSPPYTYAWAFGDGSTGTGASVTHTYSLAQTYTATLTVKDSSGTSATSSIRVVASNPPPLSVTLTASPASGVAPLPVTFTASVTSGTAPYALTWQFGDGTTTSGSSLTVTHTYTAAGQYLPSVTLTDANQGTGSSSTSVKVTGGNSPLKVVLTTGPVSGGVPFKVTATASVSGGTGTYNPLSWSFGDGNSTTGVAQVTHTYTRGGTFLLSASVSDSSGKSATNSTPITAVPLAISISLGSPEGDAPFNLSATANVSGGTGNYTRVVWAWGDGTSGTGLTAWHLYAQGPYGPETIVATVTDNASYSASNSTTITLFSPLSANLTHTMKAQSPPVNVTFTADLTGGSGNYSQAMHWDFGDNTTTVGPATESERYLKVGHFEVTVNVTDSLGGAASATTWVNVSVVIQGGPSPNGTTTPGATPPSWLGTGTGDPQDTSLALILVMALVTLALVWKGPKNLKPPSRAPHGRPPLKSARTEGDYL